MSGQDYMREAIDLAIKNISQGGGPFGAIIVKDGTIIARAYNQVTMINDPTAHAEVMAIREASKVLQNFDLSGCELYSSCEPCPMCLGAIYWARISKVFFAAGKLDAEKYGFDDHSIEKELKLDLHQRSIPMEQILQKESLQVFIEWERFVDRKEY